MRLKDKLRYIYFRHFMAESISSGISKLWLASSQFRKKAPGKNRYIVL